MCRCLEGRDSRAQAARGAYWTVRCVFCATARAECRSHVMIAALLKRPSKASRMRRAAYCATADVRESRAHPLSNSLRSTPPRLTHADLPLTIDPAAAEAAPPTHHSWYATVKHGM